MRCRQKCDRRPDSALSLRFNADDLNKVFHKHVFEFVKANEDESTERLGVEAVTVSRSRFRDFLLIFSRFSFVSLLVRASGKVKWRYRYSSELIKDLISQAGVLAGW